MKIVTDREEALGVIRANMKKSGCSEEHIQEAQKNYIKQIEAGIEVKISVL